MFRSFQLLELIVVEFKADRVNYLNTLNNLGGVSLPEGATFFMASLVKANASLTSLFLIILSVVLFSLANVVTEQRKQAVNSFRDSLYGQFNYFAFQLYGGQKSVGRKRLSSVDALDSYTNPLKPYENTFLERCFLGSGFTLGFILLIGSTALIYVLSQFHTESASCQVGAKQWLWESVSTYPVLTQHADYGLANELLLFAKTSSHIQTQSVELLYRQFSSPTPTCIISSQAICQGNTFSPILRLVNNPSVFNQGYRATWLQLGTRQTQLSNMHPTFSDLPTR